MAQSPIPVMARSLLERVLTPAKLNNWFDKVAKGQYTRDLLFSSILELMSLVVMKSFPSVNAAYQSENANIGVSFASVYNKLNCLEEKVLATLVRDTSQELSEFIGEMDGACAPLLPALFGRGEDLQIRIIRSTTVVFEKLIAADAVQSQTPVRGR